MDFIYHPLFFLPLLSYIAFIVNLDKIQQSLDTIKTSLNLSISDISDIIGLKLPKSSLAGDLNIDQISLLSAGFNLDLEEFMDNSFCTDALVTTIFRKQNLSLP